MPITLNGVSPETNPKLAELEKKVGGEHRFFRMLAHKPELLDNFVPFYQSVMKGGTLSRRHKEMAYLAVSVINECPYCEAHHLAEASQAGLSHNEIEAIRAERDFEFDDKERALLVYARSLTRSALPEHDDFLYRMFANDELVELTAVIALANFTNRISNGFHLKPEERFR